MRALFDTCLRNIQSCAYIQGRGSLGRRKYVVLTEKNGSRAWNGEDSKGRSKIYRPHQISYVVPGNVFYKNDYIDTLFAMLEM